MGSQEEIKGTTLVFMLVVAGLYDSIQFLISFIPFIGEIISIFISVFAFLTFYLWFKMYGMDFMTPKRAATMGGGFLIEMIPVVDMLPAWTCAVVILVGTTKVKELAAKSGVANTVLVATSKLPSARERMPTVPIADGQQEPLASGRDRTPLKNIGSGEVIAQNYPERQDRPPKPEPFREILDDKYKRQKSSSRSDLDDDA